MHTQTTTFSASYCPSIRVANSSSYTSASHHNCTSHAGKECSSVGCASVPACCWNFLSIIFQCRLSYHVHYSPHVQSHALMFVHQLKILSIGCHTTVWTHEDKEHTKITLEDRMWLPKRQENWKQSHMHFLSWKTGVLYPQQEGCRRSTNHGLIDGIGRFVGEDAGGQTWHHLLHAFLLTQVQHVVVDQSVDALKQSEDKHCV